MQKEELINLFNNTSTTFCLAKFHESTIWLYSSKIASCHHTTFYSTGESVVNFYNNVDRRRQQAEMLKGEKPSECNYCWKLEEKGLISDRVMKSITFKDHLPIENYFDPEFNFKPKSLELAFQNTCNLGCAYCSPSFSSEWINDIKNNGIYTNLTTDKKMHYSRGLDSNVPVNLDMFWEWFDSVATELESIRITGGEPLLHEETFKTFEKMLSVNPNVECVIHTNLCQKPVVIQRFVDSINKLKNVRINISNESAGEVAEFIRDGMVYSDWLENVRLLATKTKARLSISTTITALSLIGLDDLYRDIVKLRNENTITELYIAVNFATYPEFQSLSCLSSKERKFYLKKYKRLYDEISYGLTEYEKKLYNRLLTFLDPTHTHIDHEAYRKDSDEFFSQYVKRRNKTNDISKLLGRQ